MVRPFQARHSCRLNAEISGPSPMRSAGAVGNAAGDVEDSLPPRSGLCVGAHILVWRSPRTGPAICNGHHDMVEPARALSSPDVRARIRRTASLLSRI
eukprot:29023-Chlamydomonas_euryale.AAC.6